MYVQYTYELNDLIFFIKSPSNYFNINDFIFCSFINSNILVPLQIYPIVFIFMNFLDSGIHCQL